MNEKVMPHASDIEQSILSAMMLYPDSCQEALSLLKPDEFYKTAHQKIFSAIRDIENKAGQVDLTFLKEHLTATDKIAEVGGATYLAQLYNLIA